MPVEPDPRIKPLVERMLNEAEHWIMELNHTPTANEKHAYIMGAAAAVDFFDGYRSYRLSNAVLFALEDYLFLELS